MNTLGRLGELYGLSPATLANLGTKAGIPAAGVADQVANNSQNIAGLGAAYGGGSPDAAPVAGAPIRDADSYEGATLGVPAGPTKGPQFSLVGPPPAAPGSPQASGFTPAPTVEVSGGAAEEPSAGGGPQTQAYEPMRTIPAHETKTTREYESVGGMSPENAQAYADHRDSQLGYNQAAAGLDMHNNDVMRHAMQETGAAIKSDQLMRQHQQYLIQQQAERAQYVRDNQQQVQAAAADAARKVDPDDLWKGNTFGRVLAAIAVGLGQFGASLTHTENGAAKIIEGAIRDNIDAQKTNISNAKGRLGELRNARIDKIAELDDEANQHGALTLLYVDQAKQMAMDWAKKNGLDPNGPAMMRQMAALDGMAADAIKDVDTASNGKITQKQSYKMVQEQTVGGPTAGAVKRDGNVIKLPDGTYYQFDSKDVADKTTARVQSLADVNDTIAEIQKERKLAYDVNSVFSPTEFKKHEAALKILDKQLWSKLSVANGQGTVTDGEMKEIRSMGIGATSGLGYGQKSAAMVGLGDYEGTNAALATIRKMNERAMHTASKAGSGRLYNGGYATDPKTGKLVPTGEFTGQDDAAGTQYAPKNARPMDGRTQLPQAPASAYDTTPRAPIEGTLETPASSAIVAKHKGRK